MNPNESVSILLVEDDAAHSELICRSFKNSSGQFNITAIPSLSAARAVIEVSTPGLILLDYMLQDGYGTELLPGPDQLPESPIVLMTSHGDELIAVDAIKSGALDYIVKSGETLADMAHIAARALRQWETKIAHQQTRDAFQTLVKSSLGSIGQDFFKTIVKSVSEWLHVDCVLIGEKTESNVIRSIAMYLDGGFVDEFSYPLEGAPCANVMDGHFCLYPEKVQQSFPNDKELRDLDAEGYVGTPLVNREGKQVGVLAAMSRASLNVPPITSEVLQLIAGRAVDEIERLQADQSIRQFKNTLDQTLDSVFMIDPQTFKFLYVNQGGIKQVGYSREELFGMTPLDLTPDLPRAAFEKLARELMANQKSSHTFETLFLSKDGNRIPVEIMVQYVAPPNEEGRFVAIIRDMTERRRMENERRALEQQVQQTQKLESLGVLAGGIAHDFNNLLMGVLGNADLALEEISPVSPVSSCLQDIVTAAKRAAELCRQMLAYSGRGRFVVEAINLNELIREMSHLLEVSISKKVVLKHNMANNLPLVDVDATQMRQVIMNLITNASEAIGERSGVISLTTGAMECDQAYLHDIFIDTELPDGDYIFIEVADTGEGMDQETLKKIFDPFYTTKFTGRGLGLAAVLGIIRGHKGAIKVYSETGRGSTFKILLPASEQLVRDKGNGDADLQDWRSTGTILLVDDEETVLTVGKRVLEKNGYTVLTAQDGREGLAIYKEHVDDICCIILDLTMPQMDGEETFREMRRVRKDVCVILSSGFNEQEITQRFVGKGLAGFIQKPYRATDLLTKLKSTLAH